MFNEYVIHKVRRGESLHDIAVAHQIPYRVIYDRNRTRIFSKHVSVEVGDELVIGLADMVWPCRNNSCKIEKVRFS